MSIATWKAEFYPTDNFADMSAEEAVRHSLQKWKGLKHDQMQKHEVEWSQTGLCLVGIEEGRIRIDSDSCALCYLYNDHYCARCPLKQARAVRCDVPRDDEEASPWALRFKKPEAMIYWLERTLEWLGEEDHG